MQRNNAMSANSERSIALITGASSGIGEALAHCFARAKHDVVLVARSADKLTVLARQLEEQHQIKARVAPADLIEPESAQRLAATLKRRRRMPDVRQTCPAVVSTRCATSRAPRSSTARTAASSSMG